MSVEKKAIVTFYGKEVTIAKVRPFDVAQLKFVPYPPGVSVIFDDISDRVYPREDDSFYQLGTRVHTALMKAGIVDMDGRVISNDSIYEY